MCLYLQHDSLEGIAREEVGFPDGVKGLMAYRVLPEYGLVAIVAVGKDKVLSPWGWWNFILIVLTSSSMITILISYWVSSRMFAHERVARHALAESNKALEGRVAERTLALHQALLQAQQAVDSKSRFIAAASHDLRQPLQALRLFHSLLMSRASECDRPLLSRMEEAMGSAESLLHSLLDVSRLESGVITPVYEEFSIGDLLSSLESEFRDQADKSGCRLKVVGTSLRVVNDRMILSRIMRNLISNAVKYGHGGRIIVGCRHNGASARI